MFAEDHLTLRSTRLADGEKWAARGAGLYFLFVRGGAGKLVLNSVSHALAQGDVLVLNAAGTGKIEITGQDRLFFSSFSVLVEHLFPLFSAAEISHLQHLLVSFGRLKLYAAGHALAVKCHRLVGNAPPQLDLDHRAHLIRVVAGIFGEEFKSVQHGRPGFGTAEEHLMHVFEQLSASDLLTLSTEELAAKFSCSRRHLSRLFNQYFGFSVAELRMELRMLRAITLLRDSNAKVAHVAEQCGFNHMGLFNTCFKRRFGTSPGRWRALRLQVPSTVANQAGNQAECLADTDGACPLFGVSKPLKTGKSQPLQSSNAAICAILKQTSGADELLPPQCLPLMPQIGPLDGVGNPWLNA